MNPKIGIPGENLSKVAHALNGFLADEFLLYLKARNAHWNIEGSEDHFFLTTKCSLAGSSKISSITD